MIIKAIVYLVIIILFTSCSSKRAVGSKTELVAYIKKPHLLFISKKEFNTAILRVNSKKLKIVSAMVYLYGPAFPNVMTHEIYGPSLAPLRGYRSDTTSLPFTMAVDNIKCHDKNDSVIHVTGFLMNVK